MTHTPERVKKKISAVRYLWGGKNSSVLGEWITAATCIIAWVKGEPIGFADTNVGMDIIVFPIFGCTSFFDRKSA